jgi:1-acyl-sn-glycerol-3-phosphate acyltransferase
MLNSIISYIKVALGGICILITSILCGINPKNELFYRKTCSKILTKMFAKDIEIIGELDKDANLLIGNHTHNMDIALMETIIPEKLIWVAKKELGETPIIKYMLTKTDMILVDRSNKRSILQMIKEIKNRVERGFKVVLFPEGTRNKIDPTKMITWKKGVKGVAEKLNLKVQPFVIINLPFAFKKNPFRIEKQKIKVIFLKSFYPSENPNWYEDTRKKMQEILNKEYKEKV